MGRSVYGVLVASPGARRPALLACVLVLATTGCGTVRDFFDERPVFESAVEPVELEITAPAYTAAVRGGLLVRNGDERVVLPRASSATWLPDGRALASSYGRVRVVDPGEGLVGPLVRTFTDPGTSVEQIDLVRGLDGDRLSSYDLGLSPLGTLDLPETDDPAAETPGSDVARGYYGSVATLGGTTFVQWHDGGEDHEGGDYGVLRIEGDELSNVLVNEGIVSLWLVPDGAALLAVRQVDGQPCGGCVVPQEVVELDPATGDVVGEYGMPEGYEDDWRVQAIDKVGDRVAVRFHEARPQAGYQQDVPTGTWVYDGAWELLEGSDEVTTWWQGPDDRIEARPAHEPAQKDGFELVWVSGEEETVLPGELVWARGRASAYGSVAGRLLPPA